MVSSCLTQPSFLVNHETGTEFGMLLAKKENSIAWKAGEDSALAQQDWAG